MFDDGGVCFGLAALYAGDNDYHRYSGISVEQCHNNGIKIYFIGYNEEMRASHDAAQDVVKEEHRFFESKAAHKCWQLSMRATKVGKGPHRGLVGYTIASDERSVRVRVVGSGEVVSVDRADVEEGYSVGDEDEDVNVPHFSTGLTGLPVAYRQNILSRVKSPICPTGPHFLEIEDVSCLPVRN